MADSITTALAVWGAVLSTATLGWTLYREHKQRGRLKVTCYVGQIVGDPRFPPTKKWVIWRVTNVGKEPVVVTNIGGSFGATHFVINTAKPLPATLKPGEYFSAETDDFTVLKPELVYFAAYDSLGRTFKAPNKSVRDMKRKYAAGDYKDEKQSGLIG